MSSANNNSFNTFLVWNRTFMQNHIKKSDHSAPLKRSQSKICRHGWLDIICVNLHTTVGWTTTERLQCTALNSIGVSLSSKMPMTNTSIQMLVTACYLVQKSYDLAIQLLTFQLNDSLESDIVFHISSKAVSSDVKTVISTRIYILTWKWVSIEMFNQHHVII